MIIGIDGNEANIEKRVGVNVYAFELLWGLSKLAKNEDPITFRIYLNREPLSDMPPQTENWRYRVVHGNKLWILTKLMPDLYTFSPKPTIFFTPSHYIPLFAPCACVCSIMDLGYLKFSGQFKKYDFWQLKLWSAYSIFRSKYIIAISQATAKDIVRHYSFAKDKVKVTPLAYDKDKFNTHISTKDVRRIMHKYAIVNEYVLFLGTLKPSKNIEGLLTAWSSVVKVFPSIKLVIAGKKGWLYNTIFEKVGSLGLQNKVIFTDFISEEDKRYITKGAKLFVLPSFWEGFGLDVLNAMACGVPVIVSDRGSLPEVVGKGGIIVPADKPSELANAIIRVLRMPKKDYNILCQAGIDRSQDFSWGKTAQDTLALLKLAAK